MTSAYVIANGGNGGLGTLGGGGGAGGCVSLSVNNTIASGKVNASANGGTTPCKTYVNNGTLTSKCPLGNSFSFSFCVFVLLFLLFTFFSFFLRFLF